MIHSTFHLCNSFVSFLESPPSRGNDKAAPRARSVVATGVPGGECIRGNTINVPSQSALPREVYQSSRRETVCDRRFRAFHMLNIIAKRQTARNPRGVVRRTRVLFGSCTVCRLVHVLVPLRASCRHIDDTGKCTENDTRILLGEIGGPGGT